MVKVAPIRLVKGAPPTPALVPAQARPKKPAAAKKKRASPRSRSASPTSLATAQADASKAAFPIVGIGASAGGLEAIEQFLSSVPVDSGMAFVVVQHLDPDRKGLLVELLQRASPLPVQEITDRVRVRPNHVYVIPPGFDLSILHGVLHLLEPTAPRGLRLPIDYFLRSLAADQVDRSIGVILSGMGSDGTLGLRAIKEHAGGTFVQSAASAKFDGMPRSAIDAGLADVVAPAEELAAKIISFVRHAPLMAMRSDVAVADANQSGLEKIVVLLRAQTGHDFSLYKTSSIYRRIERRMALHQLKKIADYVRYLRFNPQETDLLFKELLIGVTSFFRDPKVWEQLKVDVIPSLLALHPEGGTLRAWVPACSTGEEAYSLAMVFREALELARPSVHYSLQVFATDLDSAAIDRARLGIYPSSISADVPEAQLRRYFVQDNGGYRVSKEVREMIIFAPQNLVMDPPFTKLDLLTCRNLLIYLEADLQKMVLPLFHYSLQPGGVLVLGSAETVGNATDLFAALPGNNRIYRRRETLLGPDLLAFPAAYAGRRLREQPIVDLLPSQPTAAVVPNLQVLTDTLMLQRFTPAAVLSTDKGDIVYISGRTGSYLEPAAGKVNNNLFAMARTGLASPLSEAFARAVRKGAAVKLKGITVDTNGGTKVVDVSIQPLSEPAGLRGKVLVVFADVETPVTPNPAPSKAQKASVHANQVAALSQDAQHAREDLKIMREEMQTAQEELKSTNEELQSANEELQSTNEELTTSKEEMQSMNEELQTVNHELVAKVDELSQASDDMKNLLNCTDIATLFLDNNLKVRRFTTKATHIFKLIPGDTGRPISDLVSVLDYPALVDDAREVLRTLVFHEVQVAAKGERWFAVRTMPYRTQENLISGVVITFVDISATKALEATLREAQTVLQERLHAQDAQLDTANALEIVLNKAQAVMEKRFTSQTTELHQVQTELQNEKDLRPGKEAHDSA